jgi:hypothetical protein
MNKFDFLNFSFQYMDVIYDSLMYDSLANSRELARNRMRDFELALSFASSQSRFDPKDPAPAHELFREHVGSLTHSQLGVCATFMCFVPGFFFVYQMPLSKTGVLISRDCGSHVCD